MPRQPLISPETSLSLPRTAVLKSLSAVPVSTATATGQVFSSEQICNGLVPASLGAAIAADERFAEFDRLTFEIVDLDLRQQEAFEEYDDDTKASCTEKSEEDGSEPWVVLWSRLVNEDLACFTAETCQSPRTFLDVVLQAKISDYHFAVGDVGFDEANEICSISTRNFLRFLGLQPQIPIKELRKRAAAHVARAEEYAAIKPRTPMGVNAGNIILKTRRIGKAADAAIRREASLEDRMPASERAIEITKRRFDELEALRDEIIAGVNRASADRYEDDPYSMSQAHLLAVWIELIEALRPEFFDDSAHGSVGPVLKQLRKEASSWSETFIEQATTWNKEQGVANV